MSQHLWSLVTPGGGYGVTTWHNINFVVTGHSGVAASDTARSQSQHPIRCHNMSQHLWSLVTRWWWHDAARTQSQHPIECFKIYQKHIKLYQNLPREYHKLSRTVTSFVELRDLSITKRCHNVSQHLWSLVTRGWRRRIPPAVSHNIRHGVTTCHNICGHWSLGGRGVRYRP